MRKQDLLILVALILVTPAYLSGKDNNGLFQWAFGQAEESFGQNTTFAEELKRMQGENQTQTQIASIGQSESNMPAHSVMEQSSEQAGRGYNFDEADPQQTMLALGKNLYIVWETNETGNPEIMFRASNDLGKTFTDVINLSNSPQIDSKRSEIASSQNDVFVSWQEESPNDSKTEYKMRISRDGGLTFGPILDLSENNTVGEAQILPDPSRYENLEQGLFLEYPSGWEVINGSNPNYTNTFDVVAFLSPLELRLDNYRENLRVSIDNLRRENTTIEEYSNGLADYKQETLSGFRLLDFSNSDSNVLTDRPAYRIIYTYDNDDGTIIKEMETGAKIDDKIYYLTYSAQISKYGDVLPIINEMVSSFRVSNK